MWVSLNNLKVLNCLVLFRQGADLYIIECIEVPRCEVKVRDLFYVNSLAEFSYRIEDST